MGSSLALPLFFQPTKPRAVIRSNVAAFQASAQRKKTLLSSLQMTPFRAQHLLPSPSSSWVSGEAGEEPTASPALRWGPPTAALAVLHPRCTTAERSWLLGPSNRTVPTNTLMPRQRGSFWHSSSAPG